MIRFWVWKEGGAKLKVGRYLKIPAYNDDYIQNDAGNFTLYGKQDVSTRTEVDFWRCVANALGCALPPFGVSYKTKGDIAFV